MTSAVFEMFQLFSRSFWTRYARSAASLNSRRVLAGGVLLAGAAADAPAGAAARVSGAGAVAVRDSPLRISPGKSSCRTTFAGLMIMTRSSVLSAVEDVSEVQ